MLFLLGEFLLGESRMKFLPAVSSFPPPPALNEIEKNGLEMGKMWRDGGMEGDGSRKKHFNALLKVCALVGWLGICLQFSSVSLFLFYFVSLLRS